MLIEGVKVPAEVASRRLQVPEAGSRETGVAVGFGQAVRSTVLAFGVDAPFLVSQLLAGGALELRPDRGHPEPIAGNLWVASAPRLVEPARQETTSRMRGKGQICVDLRRAEGGRHERATRGCSAFVAPPYKNARCLKLGETIRGWTPSGGAVGCCGALEAIPRVRPILNKAGRAVMQQNTSVGFRRRGNARLDDREAVEMCWPVHQGARSKLWPVFQRPGNPENATWQKLEDREVRPAHIGSGKWVQ